MLALLFQPLGFSLLRRFLATRMPLVPAIIASHVPGLLEEAALVLFQNWSGVRNVTGLFCAPAIFIWERRLPGGYTRMFR